MDFRVITLAAAVFLSGCATTSIQPLSRDSFKVDTSAESMCGPAGARNLAFQTAAIEVIRKGGDRFVIASDSTDFDGWTGTSRQGMVVRMIPTGSPEAANALSARETLGPDWARATRTGAPMSCL